MNESILIVDDEKEIADLIEVYLKMTDTRYINSIMVWMLWDVLKRKNGFGNFRCNASRY